MRLSLLIGGLLLLLLIGGVELYLAGGGLSAPVRDAALKWSREKLGEEVSIDRVRLSVLPPRVVVSGISLPPQGNQFGGGSIGEIRVSLWSLLRGGLRTFDVRVMSPDLTLIAAASSDPDRLARLLADALRTLEQGEAARHRVRLRDATIHIHSGDARLTWSDLNAETEPDVILRRRRLLVSAGVLRSGDAEVLSSASLRAEVSGSRVHIRSATFVAAPGSLELQGDLRLENGAAVLGLHTVYEGSVPAAVAMLRNLGVEAPEVAGSMRAEGRLFGPPTDPNWDGEIQGTDLELKGDPRTFPSATVRVRVSRKQLEVVHSRARAAEGELRAKGSVTFGKPVAYRLDVGLDHVALAWLLRGRTALGNLSGEARLQGVQGKLPIVDATWQYDNPQRRMIDSSHRLWERGAAFTASATGQAWLREDGSQHHVFSVLTPRSKLTASADLSPERQLAGEVQVQSTDFGEIGELFRLGYVHGAVTAQGALSGTLEDFRLVGNAEMPAARARNLVLGQVSSDIELNREKLVFRHLESRGAGRTNMDGEVWFPPLDKAQEGVTIHASISVEEVPLAPLAALFHSGTQMPLDFPVTGDVHVVSTPESLSVWSLVTAGAGSIYGQPLSDARADMWIDGKHMALRNVRMGVPVADQRAEVRGAGSIEWASEHFEVTAETAGLPAAAVALLREKVPYLGGAFAGNAALTGDFEAATLSATGKVRDFTVGGMRIGDGTVVVELSPWWQLRVRATLDNPDGERGVASAPAAWVNYYSMLDRGFPFHVAARVAQPVSLVPWLREMVPELDALFAEQLGKDYGMLARGRVTLSGDEAAGVARALASVNGMTVATGPLSASSTGTTRMTLEGDDLQFSPLVLSGDGLRLTLSGGMLLDHSFDMFAKGEVGSTWVRQLRPDWGVRSGAAGFDLHISDGWDDTRLSGSASLHKLEASPPDLLPEWAALFASGEVKLDGPLEDPMRGSMNARLGPAALVLFGNRLEAPTVLVDAVDGVYSLTPVELTGSGGQLRVEGGFHYEKSVEMKAVGSLELSELVRQLDGLEQGMGTVRVSVEQSGGWDTSRLRGGATLENGRVFITSLGQTFSVSSASLLVDDTRVLLDHAEGKIGGGEVTAQGVFDMATLEGRLAAEVDQYTAHPLPGLSGTVSGQVVVEGKYPAPKVSGDIRIQRALYDRNMQWGDWASESPIATTIAAGGPGVGDTRLALHVYGERDLFVDNNLAEMALDVDLLVGGTVAEPSLLGRVDSRGGTVQYRDHVFELERASMEFATEGTIDPWLDVVAHTVVQHALPDDPLRTEPIDVEVVLSGRPQGEMDLVLSSRPDMPQNDLFALLAVGVTSEQLNEAAAQASLSEAISLATGPLQGQLERQLQQTVGIDRFQVDPYYNEATANSNARVTVGKTLFDARAQITYSTVLDATQEPVIQLTYRLGPRLSVLMEQDEAGRRGGELRFRIRFR
ncbi:MAG: translocation/assembly module TamB domain-containing protein [Nitrospirota bacterium]|nr:translocation/assembly module TamB domain-containing protein [Nitrospirota bacterium]